jgi:hypothetical protein
MVEATVIGRYDVEPVTGKYWYNIKDRSARVRKVYEEELFATFDEAVDHFVERYTLTAP